jgi:arginine utilization protein RocB
VVGKESHACYPMDGINAAYLAAELVAEMEFAPELGEQSGAEFASAPTSLGMKDLKSVYNVTTPGRVWTFWNILTQRRTAAEVLRIAHEIAERAVARSRQRIEERAVRAPGGVPPNGAWSRLSVIGFAELHARAVARDSSFAQRFKARAAELARADDLDFPTRSQILTELAWEGAGIEDPAIVLGFASMPYPAVNWPISGSADRLREVILDGLRLTSEQTGVDISTRYHLPVIVDMSFLGPVEVDDLTAVADATPIWGSSIRWSMNEPTPAIPMVNIGPWGRDYHHWLERVEEHYAFEVLPHLLANVTQGVLASRMG